MFFLALKFNEKFKRFCVLYKDYYMYFNPYLYEYSYFRIIHEYSTHTINVALFLVILLHTNWFTCAIPTITFSLHFSPYAHQSKICHIMAARSHCMWLFMSMTTRRHQNMHYIIYPALVLFEQANSIDWINFCYIRSLTKK